MKINGEELSDIIAEAKRLNDNPEIISEVEEEDGSITVTVKEEFPQVIEMYNPFTFSKVLIIRQMIDGLIKKTIINYGEKS